ncbi:MAG: IPT/TIG domain-containing protein [Thermomicrobiales bacterium]
MGRSVQRIGGKRVGIALVFAIVLAGLVMVGHATTAPPDVAIAMQGFQFVTPNGTINVTIPVGTKVTWTNNDPSPIQHTATSDPAVTPAFNSGPLIHGASFSLTFNQTGVFPYHCFFHGNPGLGMHGTITVVAVPPSPTGVTPTFGTSTGGTNVTITGSGFQTGAAVTFGGVAATNVSVLDANTITATTPAHPSGTVDIVVTNPDMTAGTLASRFLFVALPPPQPSVAPIIGAQPLPPTRVPGAPNPTPPNPLPPTRPPGPGARPAPVPNEGPAPAPLPPRR